MTATSSTATAPKERPLWRSVAIPNEHGGWGLTVEPVLLALIVAPSLAGAALGVAAVLAFVVRTPLKLVSIDVRHHRWVDRSRLAARVAAVEMMAIALLGLTALLLAGWSWLVPVGIAAPLVAVEWWYDSRSRGRRLVPELTGAVGIAAVAATIVVAGDGPTSVAAAVWMILAARSIGAIPFVRVQIARLRRGAGQARGSDLAQLASVAVAVAAVAVDRGVVAGAVVIVAMAVLQSVWVRRPPVPAKQLGFTQLGLGLALAIVTGVGLVVT